MNYTKDSQLSWKKRPKATALNKKANKKLKELKIKLDIRHCELCPNTGTTNAHRHPRRWYKDKDPSLLWDESQVLFLCIPCHSKLDDRSKTTEKQKEAVFNYLRQ